MDALITPSEMRAALDLPDTVTDQELQPLCNSATDLVVRLLVPADYTDNPTVCEAVLTVASQIFQQRQSPGGGFVGIDMQVQTPYLLGPGLMSRISGLISSYKAAGVYVG